jgi:hypothetical protein
MYKNELLESYRGGVAYRAAGVIPMTARTWTKTVDLNIGQRGASGHPRYDLLDIVSLRIMKQLTQETMMAAGLAAVVVNQLRPMLPGVISEVVNSQHTAGGWQWDGLPVAVLSQAGQLPASSKPTTSVRILETEEDLVKCLLDRSGLSCPVVIKLRVHINAARLALLNIASGDMPADEVGQ